MSEVNGSHDAAQYAERLFHVLWEASQIIQRSKYHTATKSQALHDASLASCMKMDAVTNIHLSHTWHAPLCVVVHPPAVCQPKSEGQEVRLCGELVGEDDAAAPQQSLLAFENVIIRAVNIQPAACHRYYRIFASPGRIFKPNLAVGFNSYLRWHLAPACQQQRQMEAIPITRVH